MESSVGLVVLHYLLASETINAVESFLLNIDTKEYQIVVVDNASENGSYEKVQQYFCDNNRVHCIHNEQNLGFSAGNNRGIQYLRKHWNFDYIILSNNDVTLNSNDMVQQLDREYERSSFAVAGPSIINTNSSDKVNTNPYKYALPERDLYGNITGKREQYNPLKSFKVSSLVKYLYHTMRYVCYSLWYFFIRKRLRNNLERIKSYNERYYKENNHEYNIILHGCYIIFSKEYFEYFEGLDEVLYMYEEEYLLYYHLCEKNLKSVFLPEIQITHNHAASTKATNNSQFFIENWSKSKDTLNRILYFS